MLGKTTALVDVLQTSRTLRTVATNRDSETAWAAAALVIQTYRSHRFLMIVFLPAKQLAPAPLYARIDLA